jgi:hypothetical protein
MTKATASLVASPPTASRREDADVNVLFANALEQGAHARLMHFAHKITIARANFGNVRGGLRPRQSRLPKMTGAGAAFWPFMPKAFAMFNGSGASVQQILRTHASNALA